MRARGWKAGAIGAGDLGFGCARRTKLTGGVHGSAAAGACGGCGGRRRQVGPGASVARARQVRLCGRCGLVERRRGRAGLRGWAVRSWAKPEAVGRARKWNRGTGLGPREEEEGREVGRGEAGSG